MGQAWWKNGVHIKGKFATPDRSNSATNIDYPNKLDEKATFSHMPSVIKEEDHEDSTSGMSKAIAIGDDLLILFSRIFRNSWIFPSNSALGDWGGQFLECA